MSSQQSSVFQRSEREIPVHRETAALHRAKILRWLFPRLINSRAVQTRERAEILDSVFAFFLRHDLIRDHRLREATAFGHHPRENVREVCLGLVLGPSLTTHHALLQSSSPFESGCYFKPGPDEIFETVKVSVEWSKSKSRKPAAVYWGKAYLSP